MYFPIIDVLKENFIAKIPSIVTQWLTDNVDPVGSAVVVDESLSISGAAADAKVTGDEISNLKSELEQSIGDIKTTETDVVLGTAESGTYKGEVGETIDGSGTSTSYAKYSAVSVAEGEKYTLTVHQATSTRYNHFAWATDNSNMIIAAYGEVKETAGDYTYSFTIPSGATKLYVMTQIRDTINPFVPTLKRIVLLSLQEQLNDITGLNINILSCFTNITCIGDSLTLSMVYTSANTTRRAFTTYPETLAQRTGAEVSYIAKSGASASEWWSLYAEQIVNKTNQLTIIYLGTNQGLTDTIDTDCVGNDPSLWADTNTGCYAKIIAASIAAESRVLLVKCYAGQNTATTNNVIEQMAERFGVAYVENENFTDDKYHSYPDGTGTNSVHYNDFGYAAFTDQLIKNAGSLNTTLMKRIIPIA